MINNWLFKSCALSSYIYDHEDHGKNKSNKLKLRKVSKSKLCVGYLCLFISNVIHLQGDIKNNTYILTTNWNDINVSSKIKDFNNEPILHKIWYNIWNKSIYSHIKKIYQKSCNYLFPKKHLT